MREHILDNIEREGGRERHTADRQTDRQSSKGLALDSLRHSLAM